MRFSRGLTPEQMQLIDDEVSLSVTTVRSASSRNRLCRNNRVSKNGYASNRHQRRPTASTFPQDPAQHAHIARHAIFHVVIFNKQTRDVRLRAAASTSAGD
jgi:hypothetical protein